MHKGNKGNKIEFGVFILEELKNHRALPSPKNLGKETMSWLPEGFRHSYCAKEHLGIMPVKFIK